MDQPINTSFRIQTFGCKVNTYDSGLLENRMAKANFALNEDSPDVYLLNTCAVTAEATKEALREIRKIKSKNPHSVVVVTGCSAQVDTEKFTLESGADLVVANSHKGQIEELIREYLKNKNIERIYKSNIFHKSDLEEGGGQDEEHTRSFLKIQDGCNSFCTFCVIPFARGKSRSLTIDHLRGRVNELLTHGVKEIVLTGVHIGDYEFGLENLVSNILLHTRVPRLRLTSLEPIEVSDRLLELYEDPRLCPHFHMSIQSATTSVLTGMKRKYTAVEVEESLQRIHNKLPHAFIGMDVIAGFPGEGDEEFAETYQRLLSLPWTKLHVFPYSERPGTYAVRLNDKNSPMVIQRRADQLRTLSRERYSREIQKQVGVVKKVLMLDEMRGLSRDYWNIHLANPVSADRINSEIKVIVKGIKAQAQSHLEHVLLGELIDA